MSTAHSSPFLGPLGVPDLCLNQDIQEVSPTHSYQTSGLHQCYVKYWKSLWDKHLYLFSSLLSACALVILQLFMTELDTSFLLSNYLILDFIRQRYKAFWNVQTAALQLPTVALLLQQMKSISSKFLTFILWFNSTLQHRREIPLSVGEPQKWTGGAITSLQFRKPRNKHLWITRELQNTVF